MTLTGWLGQPGSLEGEINQSHSGYLLEPVATSVFCKGPDVHTSDFAGHSGSGSYLTASVRKQPYPI